MILITSFGEFSFFNLFSVIQSVFFYYFHFTKKKRKNKGRIVFLLSCVCLVLAIGLHVPTGLYYDQMESPHEEQQSQ